MDPINGLIFHHHEDEATCVQIFPEELVKGKFYPIDYSISYVYVYVYVYPILSYVYVYVYPILCLCLCLSYISYPMSILCLSYLTYPVLVLYLIFLALRKALEQSTFDRQLQSIHIIE